MKKTIKAIKTSEKMTGSYANLKPSERRRMIREAANEIAQSQQKIYRQYEKKYGKLPTFNFGFQ